MKNRNRRIHLIIKNPIEIIKKLIGFFGVVTTLFFANLLSKTIQLLFIYNRIQGIESLLFMFLFSIIFHFSLVLIYDYLKIDLLSFEEMKMKKDIRKRNLKQKFSKSWIEELINYFSNNIGWFKKLTEYFEKIVWIKKAKNFLIFTILNLSDPMIVVIYYRKGSSKWNRIPDLKTFLYFFISCLICSLSLFGIFFFSEKVLL